ncbi:hypothetical protein SESBI_10785 [Sesbania bispinosa]|nr:hypothetical protein SESBI_10785 [Sesbania bispinosa]
MDENRDKCRNSSAINVMSSISSSEERTVASSLLLLHNRIPTMTTGTTLVVTVGAMAETLNLKGRVGRALQDMGNGQDLLIKRGDSVPLDFEGPVLVYTRNDDLDSMLQSTPPFRWTDLVFFLNGMLEPYLESKGLNDSDQVLAYFVVSKLEESPIDGKTDTNPEELTAAYGKWASTVSNRLHAGGLSGMVLDKEAFQKKMCHGKRIPL